MDSLKKLHKQLKEDEALKKLTQEATKVSTLIINKTPEQFAVSEEHQILCDYLEKTKFDAIKQTFKELPEIPCITAIIIKATKQFTLAFLMIPAQKNFGWHDHSKMNGISRCISGQLEIKSLNPTFLQAEETLQGHKTYSYPIERVRQENLSPRGKNISIIYPDSYNIHQIHAKKQSCFLDLLMPQYPDNNCHYYKSVEFNNKQVKQVEQKIYLEKVEECGEQVSGIQALVKAFRGIEKERKKKEK